MNEQIQLSDSLIELSSDVLEACRQAGLRISTAESCTGGLIAGTLTEIAGSSDVVDRGFVTYSNEAKSDMLGVPSGLIARHGAVSEEVALGMAAGALAHSAADLAVAVTGIAGPGGGTAEKPVGLVHIAVQRAGAPAHHEEKRYGALSRREIRLRTVEDALTMLMDLSGRVDAQAMER